MVSTTYSAMPGSSWPNASVKRALLLAAVRAPDRHRLDEQRPAREVRDGERLAGRDVGQLGGRPRVGRERVGGGVRGRRGAGGAGVRRRGRGRRRRGGARIGGRGRVQRGRRRHRPSRPAGRRRGRHQPADAIGSADPHAARSTYGQGAHEHRRPRSSSCSSSRHPVVSSPCWVAGRHASRRVRDSPVTSIAGRRAWPRGASIYA